MKRNLNTSYRLVWNEVLGAFVVVSELAKAKGKRTGAVLALAVAGLTSGTALAAETSVPVGETTDGVVISNNDTQSVFGEANNTVINTGYEFTGDEEDKNTGGQFVQAGGVASQTTINNNGLQRVNSGGRADGTIVNTGGGQSLAGQSSGTVLNGGEQWVHSGGVASGTVINEGGYMVVKEGAQAVGTVVNTGAQGGPDAENSDGMFVSGTATNTTINENGRQVVFEQGTAIATTIKSGGDQSVHGQAKNTVLNGGYQYVHSGALAMDTVVNSGGWQVVKAEGTANNTVINANGRQSVSGNANSTILNGALNVGGECGFDCINHYDFATQEVRDGGVATQTTINAGGSQLITTGGRSDTTTINADGRQIVDGGTAANTIIKENAWQSVRNNGHAIDTTLGNVDSAELLSDLAYQNVSAGGIAEGTVINNGGVQSVYEGGTALNSVVNRGGRLEISVWDEEPVSGQQTPAAGAARNVTVNADGWLSVDSGASATDVVMKKGSALWATTDSTVKGSNSLGAFDIDGATKQASNVLLENGGRLEVLSDGIADATTVDKGGILAVNNGGTATDVTMKEGGALIADSGSTVSGTNVRGEFSIDAASGNARGLWLENGGRFTVKAGAVAENTTVGSGGELSIGNGGRLSGTTSLTENANLTITGDVISRGTIENAGSITFASVPSGKVMARLLAASSANAFTPRTLTTTNLVGQGGTINMNINLANPDFPTDMLVIDGGQATGKTWLNFTNAGDAGLGLATTGDGIKVVDAINGATTDAGAFALGKKLQAGAYNYVLNHGTADENWYLSSEAGYRAEVALYASLFAQSMDYDRALAGSYSQRSAVNGDSGVWGRIQGGHMGHDNNGGIAHGATPESSGSYGFVQLGGDLLSTPSLNAGVYGAAGHSSVDVKDDDRSRAGAVRDDVYSLGGYLTAVHANSGLWADVVAQGSRHNLKASSGADSFDTHGWGWLASLETGLPFNVTDGLVVEPQLQYIWQGLSLNNGHDNGGYVNFGDGSAQHLRAGLRFGSQSELTFGNGTSTQAGFGDSMKHSVSELPVNWWVRPSVIRTFSTDGDLHMGTTTAGSNVTFTPSQNGTSVDFQAGIDALIRQNVTLGIQGGYTRSVSGNSADGYNGQATLKVAF